MARVTGFDLTFSSPKSVSVAWALGNPGLARIVAAAHDRAVAETVGVFEAVLRARRGHGGLTQVETDGAVAAAFAHRTSRAGDPHLHTHVVVANMTVDAAGHWSAPDGRRVYGWAKTLGYLYHQASLRHELSESLGLQWGPVRNGAPDSPASPRPRWRCSPSGGPRSQPSSNGSGSTRPLRPAPPHWRHDRPRNRRPVWPSCGPAGRNEPRPPKSPTSAT